MIKCSVTGNMVQIYQVRDIFKKQISGDYNSRVRELIPEAAVHGASKCTAVFYVNVDFLDCTMFTSLSAPAIRLVFENGVEFSKPAKKKHGYWSSNLPEVEFLQNICAELDEESELLDDFEDLEHWELRRNKHKVNV